MLLLQHESGHPPGRTPPAVPKTALSLSPHVCTRPAILLSRICIQRFICIALSLTVSEGFRCRMSI